MLQVVVKRVEDQLTFGVARGMGRKQPIRKAGVS